MQLNWAKKSNLKMSSARKTTPSNRRRINYLFAFVLLASVQLNQITCTSSYIGDYFLPTAKFALNKIQQSFSPATNEQIFANNNLTTTTTTRQSSEQQTQASINDKLLIDDDSKAKISATDRDQNEPPKSGSSSRVEYDELSKSDDENLSKTSLAAEQDKNAEAKQQPATTTFATILSSTDSISEDPTTTAAAAATTDKLEEADRQPQLEQKNGNNNIIDKTPVDSNEDNEPMTSNDVNTNPEPTINKQSGDTNQEQTAATPTTATTQLAIGRNEETTTAASTTTIQAMDQEQQQNSNLLNSIRDTELEAIAAVDASIAFGSSTDLFSSLTDNCYDEYGNARFCEPEFENIALERPVSVSSECGRPASRFCTTYLNERNDQIRNCHICDQQHLKKHHPAAYLTDLNNPTSPTCWVSAPIGHNKNGQNSNKLQRDNVTLTLNLGKSYEITYISLQFCSLKPDSLVIYRSQDFGSNWSPYQFYSSQCKQMYGLEQLAASAAARAEPQQQQFEPTCTDSHHHQNSSSSSSQPSSQTNRIAFSTLEAINKQQQQSSEKSGQLLDWMTATDIRIVLDRHQSSWIQSNLGLSHHHNLSPSFSAQTANNQTTTTIAAMIKATNNSIKIDQQQDQQQQVGESSLLNPSDTYNYAISDLTVGGRCKCNGHASRCVHGTSGQLQCDCRHNTAGRDCERCASFHFDRPWQPANQFDANPCQPCQCNGHSRRCKFDPEIYQLSGRRSGGVCTQCQDNTAGRHCHYCVEGFTRDHSRPMSDLKACKPCDCHPVGSLGRVCNQTTGQCPCKEGVTGLECNRCALGYQQSSSPSEPCIKLPENDINYEPTIELVSDDLQQQTGSDNNLDNNQSSSQSSSDVVSNEQATDHEPSIVVQQQNQQSSGDNSASFARDPNQLQPTATSGGGNQKRLLEHTNDYATPIVDSNNNDELSSSSNDEESLNQFNHQRPSYHSRNNQQPQQYPAWPARNPTANKHRHQQQQQHQPARNQWGHHSSNQWTGSHNKLPKSPRPHQQTDSYSAAMDEQDIPNNESNNLAAADLYGRPATTARINQQHFQDGQDGDQFSMQSRQPNFGYYAPPPSRPISGTTTNMRRLNHVDEMSSLVDNEEDPSGAPTLPIGENSVPIGANNNQIPPNLNDDNESSFNQIQHHQHQPHHHRTAPPIVALNEAAKQRNHHPFSGGRNNNHNQQRQHNQLNAPFVGSTQISQSSQRRRLFSQNNQFNVGDHQQQFFGHNQQPQQQQANPNSINCADCQSATKKLTVRQFCHLDYAIKATVLNKYTAEDWTRVDVEIQDIFKSLNSNLNDANNLLQATPKQARSFSSEENLFYQADEPQSISEQQQPISAATNSSTTSNTALGGQDRQPTSTNSISSASSSFAANHRLRIGSIQSIWVPTEDISCKCPKLRSKSTYLLMGLVDSKDNSVASIQLDRHGVALEWKSSLQDKLMKYQKRQAKRGC